MSTLRVLDPTAGGPRVTVAPVARLPTLRGRVLGLRVDRTWQSYLQYASHVRALAQTRLHVRDVVVYDPGVRVGTTEEERRKVEGFIRAVDAAIVGLGT